MKYLIWSAEHNAWWGMNFSGYVKDPRQAGEYTREEAAKVCESANVRLNEGLGWLYVHEVAIPKICVFPEIARREPSWGNPNAEG